MYIQFQLLWNDFRNLCFESVLIQIFSLVSVCFISVLLFIKQLFPHLIKKLGAESLSQFTKSHMAIQDTASLYQDVYLCADLLKSTYEYSVSTWCKVIYA